MAGQTLPWTPYPGFGIGAPTIPATTGRLYYDMSTTPWTPYVARAGAWQAIGTGGSAIGANPTATAGPVAVNGSAATFMRSDAAPAVGVANPTATIGAAAVNGSATTFMRSDAAPALPQKLPRHVFTVATLPAGTEGDTAFVSDATTPAFGVAVVGGGAVPTPVYYDGATWKVG